MDLASAAIELKETSDFSALVVGCEVFLASRVDVCSSLVCKLLLSFVDHLNFWLFTKNGLKGRFVYSMGKTNKLQLVAVKDIGIFAAKAIEDPNGFRNRALSLAGDELTFEEANTIFRGMYGKDLPRTFGLIGWAVKAMVAEMGLMFKWVDDNGYGANLEECKAIHPSVQNLQEYLKTSHNFEY